MTEGFNPAELNRRDTGRLKGYKELLDFYQGIHWEGRERRGDKRLTFNYAKVFIDKVTSYLMSGINFAVDPVEDSDEGRARAEKAEAALNQVYEENNLEQLDLETEIDCAILGDACYKVIWDQEARSVRITAPDIQGIYTWWVGDNTSRVWRIASKYSLSADMVAGQYKVKAKDKTASVIEVWTAEDFELWIDGAQVERKPNPYGFLPFVIYPNLREPKRFWGISDLTQIMEPQRELNRATSQLSKILELSGNPIAVLENVEESEDIAVRPGAVWNIPEDAKAYLLDLLQGGGVRLHLDYINLLYRILHDLSESPRAAFGGAERDLSGVALEIGCQLEFSPGYVTTAGNEVSSGQTFILEAYEHTSAGGKASLLLHALDGWGQIGGWVARHQFRWNKASSEMSVKDILAFVLARVGLKLEVKSQSSVITGDYPDFAIQPNNRGDAIIRRLLSFVPDVLFIEGNKGYVVNPQSSDSSVYAYGQTHSIFEGSYREGAWGLNRVQVEGYDPVGEEPVVVDSLSWNQIDKLYDRLEQLEDRNIDTVTRAEQRGQAYLREAEVEATGGAIRVPVNCGQQLYDVIDITDSRAGLSAEEKRVLGLTLNYSPRRGQYEQRLLLGAV